MVWRGISFQAQGKLVVIGNLNAQSYIPLFAYCVGLNFGRCKIIIILYKIEY